MTKREKRAHQRYSVLLTGEIGFDVDAPVACRIRDFSQNGLCIEVDDAILARYRAMGTPISEGLVVPINLSLESAEESSSISVSARIVRVMRAQIGVAYLHDEAPLVERLRDHIVYTPGEVPNEMEQSSEAVDSASLVVSREAAVNQFASLLGTSYDAFARKLSNELFSVATNCRDAQEQNELLYVLAQFEAGQVRIRNTFLETISGELHKIGHLDEPQGETDIHSFSLDELSLVEHDEMDERLLINSMTSAIQRAGGEELNHAMMRMAVLFGLETDSQIAEMAPKQIVETLMDELSSTYATVQSRQQVINVIEAAATADFSPFYKRFNNYLKEQGVVPDIRVLYQVVNRGTSDEQDRRNVIASLSGLLDSSGLLNEGGNSSYTLDDLVSHLDAIRGQGEVVRRLTEELGGGDSSFLERLSSHDRRVLEMSKELFSSLQQSDNLSSSVKSWLTRLEAAYTKTMLLDDSFIDNPQHPARKMLGLLTELGLSDEEVTADIEAAIDPVIEGIITGEDEGSELFARAMESLTPVIQDRQRRINRNVESVIDSCEGDQIVTGAKHYVSEELKQLLVGKKVPEPVKRIIESAWRQVLTLIYMRKGEGSEWNEAMELTRTLAEKSGQSDTPEYERLEMVERAESLVSEYHCNHLCEKGLFDDLRDSIKQRTKDGGVSLPEHALVEIENNSELLSATQFDVELDRDDERLTPWLDEAIKLNIGAWFRFAREDQAINVRLSWIGQNYARYVFVNSLGMKALDQRFNELVNALKNGELTPINDNDLTFVDNSIELIVERLYGQLAYQASHDELTGLVNRREFERRLGLALDQAETGDVRHVVGFINIHQLETVRKLHGYGAGNQALKELSELLDGVLGDEGCTLSRMGVDEFSVLYEGLSVEEAYRISGKQVDRVQDYRFHFADTPYSVSISIGLVPITGESKFAPTVLNEAELACTVAKNAGRNTIKLYEQDDEKLQRLDSELDWTIRVNRILEEERIVPYVQEIAPISGKGKMHYEVLMRVVDREGKVEPPAEFIDAAEKHNLMHEVDRKMISKIFSWIDANPDAMREIGKLSINLSGQSLGSERLLEYVFEQLSSYNVPRKKICFEITETAAIGNFEDASDFIDEMRNLGCSFSLDDFGSGLSSYSYLKKLPVDYLKIDGVLVKDICTEPNDYAMVRSIKEVAHFMEKKVIAEYAENDAVVEKLAEIGVDYVQGYAIARPHPIADLEV
ncbi:hypothetical protein BOW53_03810 [Solemya pervernicosa gill symbiont]|uniref:Diguanylate cyclase n=1 Tax=Solemya pervernicosa gill symbiont TaxID=642797 RepID=A0A1T2L8M3_9GAMM|nr:DUF1631 family protein [Solemya pervernicosa gill symbiont]OOZ41382.1 hypothetical protein BOW53_03810 [Solemya pervernicosa gill symbiont]